MTIKILEVYFLENAKWKAAFPDYINLLGKPLVWFYAPSTGEEKATLRTLNRPAHAKFFKLPKKRRQIYMKRLNEQLEELLKKDEKSFPAVVKSSEGEACTVFSMDQGGVPRGFIVCSGFKKKPEPSHVKLFSEFVSAVTELAYRTNELHNFYETVHPRAVALSTMHSVHRLIRQSLSIEDLLPRIARLAIQIVKAVSCTIYLLGEGQSVLMPRISIGDHKVRKPIKLGKGTEGMAAHNGEFILQKNKVIVPLIKDDVAGIIVLENKKNHVPFTRVDLEILKTLSEQAVLAIKNAELFEESEKITEGSIHSITDMLELNQRTMNVNMPFFKSIVRDIAQDLRMSKQDQAMVEQAASLLDVGHAGISQKILSKKSKLTLKEYEQIKKHPMIGAQVLSSIHSLKPVLPLILTHHEHYDGKGYPKGLKGNEIPLGARVIAIVDAFTAMTSDRPYRKKMTALAALREIEKESGRQFDPLVVKSFLKLIQKHKEWRRL